MRQVITIDTTGGVSGLHRKKGQGLDLRQFGADAKIERVSEIVFASDSTQRWYIHFLQGPLAGQIADTQHIADADIADTASGIDHEVGPFQVLLFEDYEAAVQMEVAILDGLRLKGIH